MTTPLTGTDVTILNVGSGKVLRERRAAEGPVAGQAWDKHDRDGDQRWRLVPVVATRHQYYIQNVGSGMILAVSGSSDQEGTRVILGSDTGGSREKWRVVPVANNEYVILSVDSGMALDVCGASTDDDARIAQYKCWHGPQQRWKLSSPLIPRRTRAVFTMARNERVFLPIWLRYYKQFFGAEDIYVLDHQSTDGSTTGDGFVRVPITREVFGTGWQRDLIQRYQHDLVDRYDVVLYTDVDEIVAPDPRYRDLGVYIDHFQEDFVTCRGYEVLHMREDEKPFDDTRRVLWQRSTWYPNRLYSKSLLARIPMVWHGGFHERFDRQWNRDPNLYLIHLHRMDYEICLARHKERHGFPRAEPDLKHKWGYQNRITDPDEFAYWFYHDSCGGGPIEPEEIPEHWREVV